MPAEKHTLRLTLECATVCSVRNSEVVQPPASPRDRFSMMDASVASSEPAADCQSAAVWRTALLRLAAVKPRRTGSAVARRLRCECKAEGGPCARHRLGIDTAAMKIN